MSTKRDDFRYITFTEEVTLGTGRIYHPGDVVRLRGWLAQELINRKLAKWEIERTDPKEPAHVR